MEVNLRTLNIYTKLSEPNESVPNPPSSIGQDLAEVSTYCTGGRSRNNLRVCLLQLRKKNLYIRRNVPIVM